MRRLLIVHLLLSLAGIHAAADATYPDTWRPVAAVGRGAAYGIPGVSDAWYLVRPRPAWDAEQTTIERIDINGRMTAAGLAGADVRAALPRANGMLVVVVEGRSVHLVDLDEQCRTRRRIPIGDLEGEDVGKPVDVVGGASSNYVFVRLGERLLVVDLRRSSQTVRMLEQGIRGVRYFTGGPHVGVAFVHKAGSVAYLTLMDTTLRARVAPSVPLADEATIRSVGRNIVVLTAIDGERGTQLTLIDGTSSRSQFVTLGAPPWLVMPFAVDSVTYVANVHAMRAGYVLDIAPLLSVGSVLTSSVSLPPDAGRPIRVDEHEGRLFVQTEAGLLTADASGTILSVDTLALPHDGATLVSASTADRLVLRSRRGSVILQRYDQPAWWLIRFFRETMAYIVPIVLSFVLLFAWRRLRRQRIVIDAMMELPGAGLVMLLDSDGRLVRTNERAAQVLRITANVPMRRLFQSYAVHDGVRALLGFVDETQAKRAAMTERLDLADGNGHREYLMSAVPLKGTLGRYGGMLLTGVDITEALERRRLVNWAQLAHDMQTNLSTIRLNAEQIETYDDANRERRRRMLFQVGVLMQRVRDLVSVGRTEDLNRAPVHSAELCTEVRHEFDPAVFPHVTFSMKLRGTMMNVDRLKISRAVRNAVENGIKAMRGRPGLLEITTWFDRTNVYIKVSDTGDGMDATTLANMMKPYFTTSKDGSGTGIGTMIMQHVLHLHGGSLRVTSEQGVGTQVIFRIPHGMDGSRLRNIDLGAEVEG